MKRQAQAHCSGWPSTVQLLQLGVPRLEIPVKRRELQVPAGGMEALSLACVSLRKT